MQRHIHCPQRVLVRILPAKQVDFRLAFRDRVAKDHAEQDNAVAEDATTGLMPEDFRQPKAMTRPSKPSDLKAITGVGPKLEKVLNGLGIWTFAQVAAWTPEEIAWVEDYLSLKGRIGRDDWTRQAAALTLAAKAKR